jgi:hypothetical protein
MSIITTLLTATCSTTISGWVPVPVPVQLGALVEVLWEHRYSTRAMSGRASSAGWGWGCYPILGGWVLEPELQAQLEVLEDRAKRR